MGGPFGLSALAAIGRKAIGGIEKVSCFTILIWLGRSCIAVLVAASRTRLQRVWRRALTLPPFRASRPSRP